MRQIAEEDLARAADVLVRTALRVAAGERFVAVGDQESQPMLAALEQAGRNAGAEVAALRIDLLRSYSTNHTGDRPHKVLPDAVRRAMLSAQASAFVGSSPHGESSMREQLQHIVGACSIRHAHMPGITPLAFSCGLAQGHDEITELGRALERRLEVGREITTESPDGTTLVIHPGGRPWVARFGKVDPGQSVTFPTGSILASPERVTGTFVATASLGEFFGAREGLLRDPVTFEIEDGRAVKVSGQNAQLVRDVESMLGVAPNSDRVGLVVLGVNGGSDATGEVAVDQHRPGLHLIFGDPQSKLTTAGWTARTAFAACQARSTVRIDGAVVVEDGKLRLT
jgi:aminopeptidase